MNFTFGRIFAITLSGASHAPSVGVRIEGMPAGIPLSADDFADDLAARRSGMSGTTPRRESDKPNIEGVVDGRTIGEAVTITFENKNTRSDDYSQFSTHPRPSHADLVARRRFGDDIDLRGGGIFSGRMTVAIVAAGVAAKRILPAGTGFSSVITETGGSRRKEDFQRITENAAAEGDSVGGVVECRVTGLPAGLGEPFFDSAESVISHMLFSIPGVKGVEFGDGFDGARKKGYERNDLIISADGTTATNNEGGINGGLTNGNPLVVRAAFKPTASISRPQNTYNFEHRAVEPLTVGGRHDVCIALRGRIVVEAAVAVALADLYLQSLK